MNRAMSGNCALGIVLVDGPAGTSAAFTDAERIDITLAFTHAWDSLYALSARYSPARARLLMLAELRVASLTLDPTTIPAPTTASPTPSDYVSREPLWRDPALAALGYRSGAAGISDYVNYLLAKSWSVGVTATSAYVAFVTKYHAAWMAYTHGSQAYMVIQYPWVSAPGVFEVNDPGAQGWGANWSNVVAHETGHIFGAPDEYTNSHCHSTQTFGVLNVPNGNCETDTTVAQVPCLMAHNTSDLCAFTVKTFGWVDADGDGNLDVTP